MATPRIADQIGRVLGGRYRLLAPIGTGASAHVYVAEDVTLRRRVAVKVLHPALAEDESFLRRFRAEAQQAASLRHPNVMQVFDWGEDEDGPYLVLELLGGGSLRDLLDAGSRLTPSQALLVGLEAARGLDYAHRRGLVHRDVKPANLLFDEEGRLAIADFGLARALAEAAWTEPAGAVLGTARYAAPEQAQGASVDGRADVYSLALTLVEAVTGRVPFAADTTIATLMARVDRPLQVPAELGPLAPVLEAAGVPDPAERIDAGELARRLDAVAGSLPRPTPLPLVASPEATSEVHPDDITLLPASSSSAPGGGEAPGRNGDATVAVPLLPDPAPRRSIFDHDADAEAGEPPDHVRVVDEPRRGRSKGRVAAILLVVLLAAAGIGVAFARTGVLKPQHPVPEVTNLPLDQARGAVAADHFTIKVVSEKYVEDVPAGVIVNQSPNAGEKLREGQQVRVQLSKGAAPRAVPDLTGKTTIDAQAAVEGAGFVWSAKDDYSDTVPAGTVIDWSPKDGLQPKGATITVTLSKGKQPKPVPSFLDKVYDQYQKLLQDLGFNVTRQDAFSDKVDAGKVISTTPQPGEEIQPGSSITVVVSKGPEMVAVPDLRGLSEADAGSKLQAAGLQLGDRFGPPNKRVFDTNPPAGTQVKKGSSVDIYTR
ncbi:MAG TPA: PASTA domain-containing protein [Acidimicrobiales bacterium]|nr:PASTA domain-containing protein [Acidimicrobiales bacterium]